ncbi:unnamed protein product [Phytophthora fragariaefolia]|uniref:Unnamed protein product n=1 Tax=Phytophthora fragariaefolia TaxID=1490495 RepID=A0A9W6XUB1_9STRA|nr:unnamed protein product [Phytophthora fragariaefolia]
MALALIDIARANAYLTRRIAIDTSRDRDPHRTFLTELVSELISGRWKDAWSDGKMVFGCSVDREIDTTVMATPPSIDYPVTNVHNPQLQCEVMSSKQLYKDKGRRKRECVICRYEGRYPTEVTDHCLTHSVCLCRVVHGDADTPYTCPQNTWTCWDKFHRFYLTKGLFSDRGNIRRSSTLAKIKTEHQSNLITATRLPAEGTTRQQSTPNQQHTTSHNIHQGSKARPVSKAHQGSKVLRDCNVHHVNKARQSKKTRSCGKFLIEHGKHDLHAQQILPD